MSQSPWPEDLYAVARLDWCRAHETPEGGPVAQLVCNNLARQCGSFTNATRDHQRIARTAPQLQGLLHAAEFEQWHGKCPIVEAQGICGLGGAKAYQQELWEAFADPRQRDVYDRIAGLKGPHTSEEQHAAMLTEAPDPERMLARAVAEENAAPRRLVNDYQIRALPFI